MSPPKWEWGLLAVPTSTGGRGWRYGSFWRNWGIRYRRKWVVTHLPSGRRLTEFDKLRIARRFCEAIDELSDWSSPTPSTKSVGHGIRRIALHLTGSRPDLRIVGGAP
jgi:hypothetical protein